ncbi:NAD(P)-dependent alcohol dehydrogenase [Streptomyces sp. MNU77]|uniref:NAD(P)-dependent alcohol dehydrogenase n=1 Tax=Streptomyces sp. MNU77 TaxID=1573406 RepID=UPI0005E02E8F|nr:NAD(P)-dependent alcohol dehydrogenase [Streptomyces sp. MNU77]OLO25777.1 NAD(P)-dependent alcohol dehydrogenase [Streptomyces sp. MNU77]
MRTTTAAVVPERGAAYALTELRIDDPRPDEVLVRIRAAGVCATDRSVQHGHIPVPLPAVLGHEGAGVVEAVGSGVTGVVPGDHVVLSSAFCGKCDRCMSGRAALCRDAARLSLCGTRDDGSRTLHRVGEDGPADDISCCFVGQSSFATYALAREVNVVRVPKEVPLELAAPTGCGFMTGSSAVLDMLRPHPGSSLAVFGCGSLGLAALLAAKASGCATLVAVDVLDSRLELARELGATHVVNGRDDDAVAAVRDLTGGGADYAVEAAGVPALGAQAVACTHTLGRVQLQGAPPRGSKLELDWSLVSAGRRVGGGSMGGGVPAVAVPRLLDLYLAGRFPLERLVTTYPFEDINRAAEDSASGRALKPVLLMP